MEKKALFYFILGMLFFASMYFSWVAKIFTIIFLFIAVNETTIIIKKYQEEKKRKDFLKKMENSSIFKKICPF